MLTTEKNKLQGEVLKIRQAFDARLQELFEARNDVSARVFKHELNMITLALSQLNEEERSERLASLANEQIDLSAQVSSIKLWPM